VLIVLISIGLTLFFATTLVIVLLERRSAAEARLLDTVQGFKPVAAAAPTTFQPNVIISEVSSATEKLRRRVGITDTSAAARQLALAGYRQPYQVEIFYAARLLLPALTAIAISLFVHESTVFWFVAGVLVAYYLPDLVVTSLIRKRRERVRLGLPDALDLLAICMEAGLGLDQALMRVGSELAGTHPELADEFNLISLEQRAGTPRIEAWRHMAERTKLEVVSAFVSMLVQTDRFGTPISKALAVFSDSLRTQRRQKVEELAAKTTIKMVFPLVFFIFPSMFIVLLAPAVISIIHNMQTLF
jgi:tight adherence protein C